MVVLGQAGFGALLVLGAGVIAALASVWLLAIGAAAVLEAGSGGRWRLLRLTGCPLPWRRRLLRFLVPLVAVPGLGVTAPLAATAAGQEQPTSHPDGHADGRAVGSVSAVAAALTGLPLPDRQRGTPGEPPADHPREHWVEVRPGDTLWAIAARSLPAGADLGAVARRCRHIHRSNRAVIGDDPDLIRPGQRLRVPGRGAGAPPPHRHHEEES